MKTTQLRSTLWHVHHSEAGVAYIKDGNAGDLATLVKITMGDQTAHSQDFRAIVQMIAAAPELLAVCQRLAEFDANHDQGHEALESIVFMARSAARAACRVSKAALP